MTNLTPLINSLHEASDALPAGADYDPVRVQDIVNGWLRNEGRRFVQARLELMLENGGQKPDAVQHLINTIALRGPDDGWSGRTNDARRVFHEGQRDALEQLLAEVRYG